MKKFSLLLLPLLLFACQSDKAELTADQIVNKAIEKAGGDNYEKALVEFSFRDKIYTSKRNGGLYEFTRSKTDSAGVETRDVLNNEGFERIKEGKVLQLPDSLATKYAESVNSVHYFVQLPFGLNSPAVLKKLKGEDEINGKKYYEIEVTFQQEGGGSDHEDVYMYWIDKENFTVDFLAYRFFVNDGGIRFRVAVNPRMEKSIRFVDYDNYKTEELGTPLDQLDDLYEKGKLKKVSEIKNRILKVEID